MLEVYCCPLDRMDHAKCQHYSAWLSEAERERMASFKRDEALFGFVASRALLRTVLAEKTGIAPQLLQFVRDAYDKPHLADDSVSGLVGASWHFNVSHCRDWAALAISDEAAVGVDIELCNRTNNLLGIAHRYFQPAEAAWLESLPEIQRGDRFCELWSLKEACVKWCGLGIGRAIAGVGVRIDSDRIILQLREDVASYGAPAAQLFAPAAGVRLAVIGGGRQPAQLFHGVPGSARSPLPLSALAHSV